MESKLPDMHFVTGVAHAAPFGETVVVSFAGLEPGTGADASFPITHRLVMTRDSLAQSVEFLSGWLQRGGAAPSTPPNIQ